MEALLSIGILNYTEAINERSSYATGQKKLASNLEKYRDAYTLFLLEEQVAGKDLRIHIVQGKIVAACTRQPAFVLGNGVDTLENLIEQRRAVMHTQNPVNFLEIDEATKSLLKKQNLTLSDIPQKAQKVQLKYVSNIAQGGVPIDVTEEIHPMYQEWATALLEYFGISYMGLDFMTTDYSAHPKDNAWLLEVNERAHWLHHTFSEKKQHDMPGIILNAIFGL